MELDSKFQIHKIPHLFRTEDIVKQLAAKVGEVHEVEMRAVPSRMGDFHRVRVKLMAAKPLIRVVTLAPEEQAKIFSRTCTVARISLRGSREHPNRQRQRRRKVTKGCPVD